MTEVLPPVPAHGLPVAARAPGKCIVFGEHGVVHGTPELLFALDLETQVFLSPAAEGRLNGDPKAIASNPYLARSLETLWADGAPLDVRSVSRIPRAAGLGSSAAFVAAFVAALGAATGGIGRATLAERCFQVERGAQGVGSPGDTAAVVGGGFLAVNGAAGEPLWSVVDGDRRWDVRRVPDPGWTWVVAHSGIPRSTAEAVRAVGQRLARPDGPAILDQFREVATAGIEAVGRADRHDVAGLMCRNQELLREVGVSHPRLEALISAAAPAAEGAKLTGAGAGGSIVALPSEGKEVELIRRLARAGGVPFAVRPAPEGARLLTGAGPPG
jgi:mevalonate kinase